jgi:hypothetical protein
MRRVQKFRDARNDFAETRKIESESNPDEWSIFSKHPFETLPHCV